MAALNLERLKDLSGADLQRLANNWRMTPATFALKMNDGPGGRGWKAAKHLLHIAAIVAGAIYEGNARIIVSVPPRHGKSELLSAHTPPWFFENWPRGRVISTSYGAELATDWGRACRDLMAGNAELLSTQLRVDAKRVTNFLTTHNGAMYTAGVGGPITGRGADLLLIDDYLRNFKDAMSATIREDHWNWFLSTARTRLEPGGSIVILATRWDADDLIGRILANQGTVDEGGRWIYIRLPALAEEDDPLGRAIGEALWPQRYPAHVLQEIMQELGEYWWMALYQQKPMPSMRGMAADEWFPLVDSLPHLSSMRFVRCWDLGGGGPGSDPTAGGLYGLDTSTNLFYICDMKHGTPGPAEMEEEVKETAKKDGKQTYVHIEQEPGSAGKQVISHFSRNVLRGYNVTANLPTGPKPVRASPAFAYAQAGNVRMLRGPWNRKFLDEARGFPDGDHDDQVDTFAAGWNFLLEGVFGGATWARRGRPKDPVAEAEAQGKVIYGPTGRPVSQVTWGT